MTYLSAEDVRYLHSCKNKTARIILAIIDEVGAETGFSPAQIRGRGRQAALAEARQMVMYIAHNQGLSSAEIGRAMRRDHTTVLHGIKAEKARRGE